jgi:Flp pilus assembly pilin Flp
MKRLIESFSKDAEDNSRLEYGVLAAGLALALAAVLAQLGGALTTPL